MNKRIKYQANKVAKITLLFWLMKIIATTLGETLGDFIAMTLSLGYSIGILITLVFFGLVLMIQLSLKKYNPISFWLVIIATTTVGTEISDFLDRSLHLGYTLGSLLLFCALCLTLFMWYYRYKSLSVYPIIARNKEFYYWLAILFSNSLGTAFGDFLSDVIGLTYLTGACVTGAIILAIALMHYFTKVNQILLFWIAFIFTRPFGATFGDFLTKPITKGGLNIGTLNASLLSLLIMTTLIYTSYKQQVTKKLLHENT